MIPSELYRNTAGYTAPLVSDNKNDAVPYMVSIVFTDYYL